MSVHGSVVMLMQKKPQFYLTSVTSHYQPYKLVSSWGR